MNSAAKTLVTPKLIHAERKPTKKAALLFIRYCSGTDSLNDRAFEIVQDLVPYYAIEFFFDRVEAMRRIYKA